MTWKTRALIGVNLLAMFGAGLLAHQALADPASLAGVALTSLVLTLGMTPTMQYFLKARGEAPERWWVVVAGITGTTVLLRAVEQRFFTSAASNTAAWVTIGLMAVMPFFAWRQRRH
jgi:CDP-diglyceride synthetase